MTRGDLKNQNSVFRTLKSKSDRHTDFCFVLYRRFLMTRLTISNVTADVQSDGLEGGGGVLSQF